MLTEARSNLDNLPDDELRLELKYPLDESEVLTHDTVSGDEQYFNDCINNDKIFGQVINSDKLLVVSKPFSMYKYMESVVPFLARYYNYEVRYEDMCKAKCYETANKNKMLYPKTRIYMFGDSGTNIIKLCRDTTKKRLDALFGREKKVLMYYDKLVNDKRNKDKKDKKDYIGVNKLIILETMTDKEVDETTKTSAEKKVIDKSFFSINKNSLEEFHDEIIERRLYKLLLQPKIDNINIFDDEKSESSSGSKKNNSSVTDTITSESSTDNKKEDGSYGITGEGFGLPNVGNTCWLNAYTQIIIHSKKYIDKLKIIENLISKREGKENNQISLLYSIIDFTVKLHEHVKNSTQPKENVKSYAENLNKFISTIAPYNLGTIQDSDERLLHFQQKIVEVLDLGFKKDEKGQLINTTESKILDKNKIDQYIKSGKDEMKKLINKNNPFETSLYINQNIYDNKCKTLTEDGRSEMKIHGKIKFSFSQGWLTIGDISKTNQTKNFTDAIKGLLNPTKERVDKFKCGGISKQTKVSVLFENGETIKFEIIGDPGSKTDFQIYDNKLFYSRSDQKFKPKDKNFKFIPDSGPGNLSADNNWVYVKECFDYTTEFKTQIKEVNENEIEWGEPYVSGVKIYKYDLQIDDNTPMPELLCIKIIRPGPNMGLNNFIQYSVDYKFDEIMSIQDSKGENNDYLLIGGTVNVGLGGGHYTSFVRRNDNYYYQNDLKPPELINDINNSRKNLGKTTTFVIYEKIDNFKDSKSTTTHEPPIKSIPKTTTNTSKPTTPNTRHVRFSEDDEEKNNSSGTDTETSESSIDNKTKGKNNEAAKIKDDLYFRELDEKAKKLLQISGFDTMKKKLGMEEDVTPDEQFIGGITKLYIFKDLKVCGNERSINMYLGGETHMPALTFYYESYQKMIQKIEQEIDSIDKSIKEIEENKSRLFSYDITEEVKKLNEPKKENELKNLKNKFKNFLEAFEERSKLQETIIITHLKDDKDQLNPEPYAILSKALLEESKNNRNRKNYIMFHEMLEHIITKEEEGKEKEKVHLFLESFFPEITFNIEANNFRIKQKAFINTLRYLRYLYYSCGYRDKATARINQYCNRNMPKVRLHDSDIRKKKSNWDQNIIPNIYLSVAIEDFQSIINGILDFIQEEKVEEGEKDIDSKIKERFKQKLKELKLGYGGKKKIPEKMVEDLCERFSEYLKTILKNKNRSCLSKDIGKVIKTIKNLYNKQTKKNHYHYFNENFVKKNFIYFMQIFLMDINTIFRMFRDPKIGYGHGDNIENVATKHISFYGGGWHTMFLAYFIQSYFKKDPSLERINQLPVLEDVLNSLSFVKPNDESSSKDSKSTTTR